MLETQRPSARELAICALTYASFGFAVLPLHSAQQDKLCACRRPDCQNVGKHPIPPNGLHAATRDPEVIARWWREHPEANLGIRTGRDSGIVVVDVDPRHAGEESLMQIERRYGRLPETPEAITGSGGRHFFFRHPGNADIRNATALGGFPGIDLRGDGGYVVAVPSVHQSGRTYEWEISSGLGELELVPLPRSIIDLQTGERRSDGAVGPRRSASLDSGRIVEGQRNTVLTSLAGSMRRRGMSSREIEAALDVTNRERCVPPLPRDEVGRIVASVCRYAPELVAVPPTYDLTELGNCRRLVDRYGADLRYAEGRGWLAWDDRRWRPGAKGNVIRKAKDVARRLKAEAATISDPEAAERHFKWALRSQGAYVINKTVELSWSEPEIELALEQLDADPWLLNVRNGTLDLRTGELRAHRREDLSTKLARVDYHPDARSELWDRFVQETFGEDAELIRYVQRAIGYSLTGDTREEVLFFGHGPAASGKSTFLSATKNVLGDYAMTADFETFLARRFGGGVRNDIARLAGARLVSSIEVDEGKQLAEGMIKELTGGDDVAARFLYKEHFTFRPAFKLWLIANHKPRVRDNDEAIWRRIRVIPFANPVPKEKRDPRVKAQLTDPRNSGAAILAWGVAGCIAWQREGLGLPKGVEDATASYREEMDFAARFWEERCFFSPDRWTATADLRKVYHDWCDQNDVDRPLRLDDRDFAERLRARGCIDHKLKHKRGWLGVALRTERSGDGGDER